MDLAYAEKKLTAYLSLMDQYRNVSKRNGRDVQEVADEIVAAQPTLAAVLKACSQNIVYSGVGPAVFTEHKRAILRAQGVLQDREELLQALGPRGPELRAAGLHPWVWEVAAPLWDGGHHRQAVAAAAGNLSLKVQAKLDRWDVADDALMTESLSDKPAAPGKPRLRVPATPGRPFEEALQSGAMFFARGVFSLLRNPATHNVTVEWDEQRALEALAAMSVLARVLDDAEVEKVDQ